MINLNISKEVIKYLRFRGFYPDTLLSKYVILNCLYTNQESLLDEFDDFSSSKRFMVLYIELMKDGFLSENAGEYLFKLTPLGIKLMEEISGMTTVKQPEKKPDEIEEWIQEWIELFPSGVKTGGKLLRSDKKSVLLKMKKFVKDYKYSKDLIFKGTKSYLRDREKAGWQYTKAAVYFIDKRGESSGLAEWCEKIKEDKSGTENLVFTSNTDLI